MPRISKFFFLAISLLFATVGLAQAQEYQLASHDTLRVQAVRWDPVDALFKPLDAMSGEFTIAADGTLSLPLIGDVMARGETTKSLAAIMIEQLRRQPGFSKLPDIGLEVIDHEPVYLLGAVASPGAYPFKPGLTVQQALAMAGGQLRTPASTSGNAIGEAVRFEGELQLLSDELARFEAEKERLSIDLEALAGDDPSEGTELAGMEGEILTEALSARAAQGEQIRELQQVLREQIERLKAQIDLRSEQISQASVDLENVRSLSDRGLAVSTRVTSLASSLSELESKRLQLEIALLEAQQQLNRAERDELDLLGTARARNLARINELDGEIIARQIRAQTVRTLFAQNLAAGQVVSTLEVVVETQFVLTRDEGNGPETLNVDAFEALRPGDTIEVFQLISSDPATPAD